MQGVAEFESVPPNEVNTDCTGTNCTCLVTSTFGIYPDVRWNGAVVKCEARKYDTNEVLASSENITISLGNPGNCFYVFV